MSATRLPSTTHSAHTSRFTVKPLATLLLLACTITMMPMTAFAAPETDATDTTASAPADPQVAPAATSPFRQTDTSDTPQNTDMTDALSNPNSLASGMQPSDDDLSATNQELLTRNAKLQRDVNDLETRVNVLINERSGQLFMYGAVTVAVSFILGLILGGFIFGRRERW